MTVQDDFIYVALLIVSLPAGFLIQKAETPRQRQYISSGIGVLLVTTVCGWHGLHSLITTLVNCAIIYILGPKKCHSASFIWCFGYIVFFRTTHYLGLPQVPAHANAVQLLLTLKLVGLAYEIHDTYKNKLASEETDEEGRKADLWCRFQGINPSLLDMIFYSYCYVGLLTGPYYKYRTYHDMLHQKDTKNIDYITPVMLRLKWIPLISVIYFTLSYFFNIEYASSDEIMEQPFWFRFFFMFPMFTIFRMRLYFAWMMSECVCITANLGAYPAACKPKCGQGPTDLQALKDSVDKKSVMNDFETIHNISVYGCELAPTIREGMRSWNMSVQFWLANNVYRRVPPSLKAYRMTITMMVSSFWHGIHAGYYLSFILVPPHQMAEDWMVAAYRDPKPSTKQTVFDWVCWFWKQRSLDYMAMAFMILGLRETLLYWGSVYFLGHLWIIAFLIIGYISKPKRAPKGKDKKESIMKCNRPLEGMAVNHNGDKKTE